MGKGLSLSLFSQRELTLYDLMMCQEKFYLALEISSVGTYLVV